MDKLKQPVAIHELGNEFRDKLLVKDENFQCQDSESLDKSFKKCATFPFTNVAHEKDEFHLTRSSSLPTPQKLVSAMKGGREKEGMPPKKLSVSWAADVYDPIPTLVSHYPKRKSQKHYKSNKKNGKSKQKGKNTRGSSSSSSSSKDKKHSNRKNGGSYGDNYNLPLGFLDFELSDEIGGREPNCGSSFRGKACGGTVHFAYAEAT